MNGRALLLFTIEDLTGVKISVVVVRHLHVELVGADECMLRARRLTLRQMLTMGRRAGVSVLLQSRRINHVLTTDIVEADVATGHARHEAQGVLLLLQLQVILVHGAVVTEATGERLTLRTARELRGGPLLLDRLGEPTTRRIIRAGHHAPLIEVLLIIAISCCLLAALVGYFVA